MSRVCKRKINYLNLIQLIFILRLQYHSHHSIITAITTTNNDWPLSVIDIIIQTILIKSMQTFNIINNLLLVRLMYTFLLLFFTSALVWNISPGNQIFRTFFVFMIGSMRYNLANEKFLKPQKISDTLIHFRESTEICTKSMQSLN